MIYQTTYKEKFSLPGDCPTEWPGIGMDNCTADAFYRQNTNVLRSGKKKKDNQIHKPLNKSYINSGMAIKFLPIYITNEPTITKLNNLSDGLIVLGVILAINNIKQNSTGTLVNLTTPGNILLSADAAVSALGLPPS